jgi:hypothetical protein
VDVATHHATEGEIGIHHAQVVSARVASALVHDSAPEEVVERPHETAAVSATTKAEM